MYKKVIMTGGISVLSPEKCLAKQVSRINHLRDLVKQGKETLEKANIELKNINFVIGNENYKNVSAEFSMISHLYEKSYIDSNCEATIIHTDTVDGTLSATLNKKAIEQEFEISVKLLEVKDIDVSNNERLRASLGEFLEKLSQELVQSYKEYIFLAPIGGYKVMTYLAYIVGSFYGVKTGYMYEESQVLITIPPIPISINVDWILAKTDLLQRIINEEILSYSNLSREDKDFIDENIFFFEKVQDRKDTLIALNAFGNFILKDYFKTRKFVSTKLLDYFENNKYKSFVELNFMNLIRKVKSFYRDGNKDKKIMGELMHNKRLGFDKPYVYKGSSNGSFVFRCIWDYDLEKDAIYIDKIWLNHAVYEKDINEIKKHGYTKPDKFVQIDI